MAISTNCLYAESYRLVQRMAAELGEAKNPHWETMRQNVVDGIQTHLWDLDHIRKIGAAPIMLSAKNAH